MTPDFIYFLHQRQQQREAVPSNEVIAAWAARLIGLLFPELSTRPFDSAVEVGRELDGLRTELISLMEATKACRECRTEQVAQQFFNDLPEILRLLQGDAEATLAGDPAARNLFEVIRAYPGFYALSFYRVAHNLWNLEVPLLPRILTEFAHSRTGIDIHPAARIGEHLMIDHGTGVVIGETTVIGHRVKIYQGVTLGALSITKDMGPAKRHPTVEDDVVIYSGATILGGDTVIGHHSVIGGNVWLTHSIPPGSLVFHNPEITVLQNKIVYE